MPTIARSFTARYLRFYLTIHSNVESGEELNFRVWDAPVSKEHDGITENHAFFTGTVHGTPVRSRLT